MSRRIISPAELSTGKIAQGNHFGLYKLRTKNGGAREMLCRNSVDTVACKALPLRVSASLANAISLRGRCKTSAFAQAVLDYGLFENAYVPILACDRPLTYFPGLQLSENWIYELPGGVVEDSERFTIAGVREMREELGIKKKQIVCFSRLAKPRAFDSGSHAEWVGMVAAIFTGPFSPPKAEGIRPKHCKTVHLGKIGRFLAKADKNGIGAEGYIEACHDRLLAEVLKVSR